MRKLIFAVSFIILMSGLSELLCRPVEIPDHALRQSLVRVHISPVYQDYLFPWRKNPGQDFSVTGLVAARNRILVQAGDVRRVAFLRVQKFSSYSPVQAQVEHLDLEANLALLRVDDKDFFKDLIPLASGDDPRIGAEVQAVRIDSLFRVYRERVRVSEMRVVADYGFTHLPAHIFHSNERFDAGGILVGEQRVLGYISYTDKERRNESVPISVLDTFRKRVLSGEKAFIAQGFRLTDLVDAARRKHFRLPESLQGALVSRVLPGTSAYGIIKKNDIILSINQHKLDNRGYYNDPDMGKQPASLLIARGNQGLRRPGSKVELEIFRDGHLTAIKLPLKSYRGGAERIAWFVQKKPAYIIENGLIFLELSRPLLQQAFGSGWKRKAIELAYLFEQQQYYKKPAQDRIIVLARSLPDPVNRGYESIYMKPVIDLNGKKILNLHDMADRLDRQARSGKVARLTLTGGQQVFLDLANRKAINNRIQKRYHVPALRFITN